MTHTARKFLYMLPQLSTHFQINFIPQVCTLYNSRTAECRATFICKPSSRYVAYSITHRTKHLTLFVRLVETINKEFKRICNVIIYTLCMFCIRVIMIIRFRIALYFRQFLSGRTIFLNFYSICSFLITFLKILFLLNRRVLLISNVVHESKTGVMNASLRVTQHQT
jgi:hypothetical protein